MAGGRGNFLNKTISNEQKQLRYFQRYLEAEFKINQVEDVRGFHVKQFLVSMDDKGRKPRYINDLLKVFKTFFNYMKKEGYIKTNPAKRVRNVRQPKVMIRTFSEDEILKMLNHYQGLQRELIHQPDGPHHQVLP